MRVDRREFQFIDGSSNKFWAIALDGASFTVHFGRIGTTGQAKAKAFGTEDVARREYDKLILEKTKNGYVEVTAGTSSSGAAPTPRTTPPAATAPVAATADRDGEQAPAPAAHVGSLERRVRLTEADWAQVSWRRVKPARPAQPRPFDFEACLNQVKAAGLSGWDFRVTCAKAIPARLSKEEAWFWLGALDITSYDPATLEERLRQTHARGLPDGAQVRAWARDIAARSEIIYRLAPQTLRPFFTPVELAELLLAVADAARARARWGSEEDGLRAMRNFSALIVPQMSEDERSGFRNAMEQMYDAEPDPFRAGFIVALLSIVGGGERLAAWVAKQGDRAWDLYGGGYARSVGHLDLLAGLADEASFVRETRRLLGGLRAPPDVRLWLAATEWRELDLVRDAALAPTARDEAAAIARLLALVEAPEAALPMLEVQLGSKAPAIAAEWLAAHPLLAVVGLVPAAMGEGKLAEAAREHLHTMRRNGLASVLSAAASHLSEEQGAWLQHEIPDVAEETQPELARAELPEALQTAFAQVKVSKPPGWLSVAALPPIKVAGKRLATAEVEALLAALKATPVDTSPALVAALGAHADHHSLDAFAWTLFQLWLGMGGPSKDKWAMAAIGHLGGDACVLEAHAAGAGMAGREPACARRVRPRMPAGRGQRHRPDGAQRHGAEAQVQGSEGEGAGDDGGHRAGPRLHARAARRPHRARLRARRARQPRVRLRAAPVPLRARAGDEGAGA